MTSSMTQEQSEQIFEILRRKAWEERAASAKKFKLELELMKREFDARIAVGAAATTAAVTVATQALKKMGMEEDDIIGEAAPEVTNISFFFVGLPQEQIV